MLDKRNQQLYDGDAECLSDEVNAAIVKSAGEQGINLADYDKAYILPSPAQDLNSKMDETVEQPLEVSVVPEEAPRRARYGSFITIRATLSSTITTTSTSTVGTVGLTLSPESGDTQTGCPSGSIQDYLSVCPNGC